MKPAPPPLVVCGVDGSPPSVAAAHAAARAAGLAGTGLLLVRAFGWPAGGVPGLPAGAAGRAAAEHSAAAELSRIAAEVAAGAPGCRVTSSLVDGLPDAVLTMASVVAPLLVVGAHGHSWPGGPMLGSVASGVARQAGCPVLVNRAVTRSGRVGDVGWDLPPDPDASPGVVVVGIDGGPTTGALLEVAARVAEGSGRGLWALHGSRDTDEADRVRVTSVAARVRRAHPLLWMETVTASRGPAAMLVEASATAAVVVVGRPDGPGPALLHATTRALLRRSRCSVLVQPLGPADGVAVTADLARAGVPSP